MNQKKIPKEVLLPDGTKIPKLGQGTWYMGEKSQLWQQEVKALAMGIEYGMTLIDTAEMYGEGAAEELVGEAIKPYPRETLCIVSKVYPHNAGRKNIVKSCEASLKRLGVDYLDLYLLHWRGNIPLEETVECMNELVVRGKISHWGLSNFDTEDMKELWQIPGGDRCSTNQVLYHLNSRGTEYDLQPWLKAHQLPMMAYCPMAHNLNTRQRIAQNPLVQEIAQNYGITVEQILLYFVLQQENAIAIPKASQLNHVKENAQVYNISINEEDLHRINSAFPAPQQKTYLDIL
ncbi:MAG TPA: aldo/keto reductase [Desulfitobacterium dehalogenans]|uniref:Aldo/keto reductase n=1 Tax=Desulfitobacterium dehalogenans TaxID=36854 RepID=A0A7C7D8C2_9FIRM|nr:aldo/keto reductase [Desulfitobacterium dehalogenans]